MHFLCLLWHRIRLQNVENLLHTLLCTSTTKSVNYGIMDISPELCLTRPRKWVWRRRTVTRTGHKQQWPQRRSLPASTRSWWTSAGSGWIFLLERPDAPLPWRWRRTKRTVSHWKYILAGWLSFCLEGFMWQEDSAVCHLTKTSPNTSQL